MRTRLLEQARADAVHGWDASPISSPRMVMELYDNIRNVDWTMPTETVFLSDWPHRLWDINKPHNWIGGSGAQGVGYNAPAALGAALANKHGAHHGGDRRRRRDDDDQQSLWTAAHYKIPILYLVHNNRAYHMEIMHTVRMADRRSRDTQRIRLGAISRTRHRLRDAREIDGRVRQGPISDPNDLGAAIKRAIDVVKRGEPALIDVVSQPR
jgi:acetolactate synthase-1/2/3 large subunit